MNLILICFEPSRHELAVANRFIEEIKELSADSIIPLEAFLEVNPSPTEIENLMSKRVADYKILKN